MPTPSRPAAKKSTTTARSRSRTRGRGTTLFGNEQERPLRVAWYRRASTDEGNQPYSLDAQQSRLEAYTTAHPHWTLVADYVERASGKNIDDRAQLLRLLDDASAGKFDLVLVARLDRWSRRLVDCMDTVDFLLEHEVAFHSASEHFDTTTPTGRLLLQILSMFAEFERNLIIDRVQRGNDAKVAKGLPLSSRQVPYGMTLDTKGRMAADPDTIGVVRRIFNEYANLKKGSRDIAADLNADGIPAPGTQPWSGTSVVRLLRNRAFVGNIRHLEEWYPGAHDPVLDLDVFEAAQRLLDHRAAPSAARSAASDFILTGTITCGSCGGAYVGTTGTSKGRKTHRYYSCVAAKRYGAARCSGPSLPASELEDLVITAMLEVYADHEVFAQAVLAHLDHQAAQTEPLTEQLHAQQTLIASKHRVLERYRSDYEAGKLAAERYEDRAAELEQELTVLQAHAADLELQLTAEPVRVPDAQELQRLHALLADRLRTGAPAARKGVCTALIESLVVHDRDDIAPTFRLVAPNAASDPGSAEATVEHFAGTGGPSNGLEVEGQVFAHRACGWS